MAFRLEPYIKSGKQYTNVYVEKTTLVSQLLNNVVVSESTLDGLDFHDCKVKNLFTNMTTISGIRAHHSDISESKFARGSSPSINLRNASVRNVIFEGFEFNGGSIEKQTKFNNCVFKKVTFNNVKFDGVLFNNCILDRCEFNRCTFTGIHSCLSEIENTVVLMTLCKVDKVEFNKCAIKPRVTTANIPRWEGGVKSASLHISSCFGSLLEFNKLEDHEGLKVVSFTGRVKHTRDCSTGSSVVSYHNLQKGNFIIKDNVINTTTNNSSAKKDQYDDDDSIYASIYGGYPNYNTKKEPQVPKIFYPTVFASEGL